MGLDPEGARRDRAGALRRSAIDRWRSRA